MAVEYESPGTKKGNVLWPRARERDSSCVVVCVYFQPLREGSFCRGRTRAKMCRHQNKTERPEATGQVVG